MTQSRYYAVHKYSPKEGPEGFSVTSRGWNSFTESHTPITTVPSNNVLSALCSTNQSVIWWLITYMQYAINSETHFPTCFNIPETSSCLRTTDCQVAVIKELHQLLMDKLGHSCPRFCHFD